MDIEKAVQQLVRAELGVALGSRHVLTQRAKVEQFERAGRDPTHAKRLLATFQSTQRVFVEHRDRLREVSSSYHMDESKRPSALRFVRPQDRGDMAERIRAHNWMITPLGPIAKWPSILNTLVELTLAHPFPSAIVCGPERILIYNDAIDRLLPYGSTLLGCTAETAFQSDHPLVDGAFKRVFEGESVTLDSLRFGPDPQTIGLRVHLTPVYNAAGAVAWAQLAAPEIPPNIRSGQRTDDSETHIQAFVDSLPLILWRANERGERTWSSSRWTAYTGLSAENSLGLGWLDVVHPNDRRVALASSIDGLAEGPWHADYRIHNQGEQRYRWFRTRIVSSRTTSTAGLERLGVSTEVDDLWAAHESCAALFPELQHRVQSAFRIMRSLTRQTAETSESIEDYAMHLEGRLDALGRVQAAIARAPLLGVALDGLIAEELLAAGGRENGRVALSGPRVWLSPQAAEILALVIHELATNAVKFGGMSPAGGKLKVSWQIQQRPSPRLLLGWKETTACRFERSPRRRGLGVDLLETALTSQLNATTVWTLESDGLLCTIEIPLTDRVIAREVLRRPE